MKNIKSRAKTLLLSLIIPVLLVVSTISCSKDDGPTTKELVKSAGKQIISFQFLASVNSTLNNNVQAPVNEKLKTLSATLPANTDITSLNPSIKTSSNATISPTGAQDFTDPVIYTVTAEDGTKSTYTVSVNVALSQHQILQRILDSNPTNFLGWDLQNTPDLNDLDGVITSAEGFITRLSIGQHGLSSIPEEIGQLASLTFLDISLSELSDLPLEIGQLTNLEELHLSNNFLSSIPVEIGNLRSLIFLGLDGNLLTSLPESISDLTKLDELLLDGNQLTSIPSGIGSLVNLTFLGISSNQLTALPIEIGSLQKLTVLDLSVNNLISIPEEVLQLRSLERLFYRGNELSSIAKEIGNLTNLEMLSLNNNQLTALPPELGFLTKLTQLRLTNNNLTSIPRSICFLNNFNALNLTMDSGITCAIPSQKDALISIYSANPDNALEWGVDNFPEVDFDANDNPTAIRLNNKNINRLPDIIGVFTSLELLVANNNELQSIPASIGTIGSLGILELGNNQLNTLPSELGQLNNLQLLNLTNNPLTSIPQDVCDLQTTSGGILTILSDPGEGCN